MGIFGREASVQVVVDNHQFQQVVTEVRALLEEVGAAIDRLAAAKKELVLARKELDRSLEKLKAEKRRPSVTRIL